MIENDFLECGWSAYKIYQEHQAKGWVLSSVKRLVRKIKETGSIEKGSGRPVTVCTEENEEYVDEEICSRISPRNAHESP